MFHVSFRYIFGIPPLILVLLPVTSPNCDIEKIKGGQVYENVLLISINELDRMIEIGSNCLNNESNFFKKHSCDDNKEAAFLERAARKLDQFHNMSISDQAHNTSINEDFQNHLKIVSKGTLTVVNCPGKEEKKSSKDQKKNNRCFLKKLLQKIKTCWNKILRGIKEN
ncbi:interleukin-7 isoform X2 [Ochotona princeps]|uniref:interleukin-7 isoform X2 n=1 Tax=Ochotona princeps TaxID=9978 RepID=UPI00271520BF|nr:interleukin-7 isoform X2 [Ochotona princeps]